MYDDLKTCNNQGVYKTGNNSDNPINNITKYQNETKYLQGLKPKTENIIVKNNELIIFPNPNNGLLHIKYKNSSDSKLQIISTLGVVVQVIDLSKDVQIVTTQLNNIASGVYYYKQIVDNKIINTGKLIVE